MAFTSAETFSPADFAEPTEVEYNAILSALDEAEAALRSALSQAERNTAHLHDARLEMETAVAILRGSNEFALTQGREAAGIAIAA